MELDSDMTDILNIQFPVFKFDSIAIGRKCNRVESILTLEPGEARLFALANTSKESLKRFVQSPENILRSGIIKLGKVFIKTADFFKRTGLVIIINRLSPLFPTDNSLLESAVVEKSGRIKKAIKTSFLSFVRKQPVFKGFSQLFSLLRFNVFSDRFFRHMPYGSSTVRPTLKE